jgi:hypothetical protein
MNSGTAISGNELMPLNRCCGSSIGRSVSLARMVISEAPPITSDTGKPSSSSSTNEPNRTAITVAASWLVELAPAPPRWR